MINVSTAAQLEQQLPLLQAGDTLAVEPGTYDVGLLRPRLGTFGHTAEGTPTAPITLTAADPANPPLIQGSVKLDDANYWTLSHLRIQGTLANTDTLTFNGGTGWSLLDSEVFGARQTGGHANVVVAKIGSWPMPTNWTIADNAIHDAGADATRPGTQHEIYLTAVGNTGRGLIVRNLLYNTPEGATVKIGNGGLANSPGISGVQVADNTMYCNFEQVLLHGNVSNNTVTDNLMVLSTRAMGDGGTVGVYLAGVTGTNNLIKGNYYYAITKPIFNLASTGSFTDGGDNRIRGNPQFDRTASPYFHPRTVPARAYGRYAATNAWR